MITRRLIPGLIAACDTNRSDASNADQDQSDRIDSIDLVQSYGPWLAVHVDGFCKSNEVLSFLDVSQPQFIAPLGYNAAPMFGSAQWLENWTDAGESAAFDGLVEAFRDLLRRSIRWPNAHVEFFDWQDSISEFLRKSGSGATHFHAIDGRRLEKKAAYSATLGSWSISDESSEAVDHWVNSARGPLLVDASQLISFSPESVAAVASQCGPALRESECPMLVTRVGGLGIVLGASSERIAASLVNAGIQARPCHPRDLTGGYIAWSILDQFRSQLRELHAFIRESLPFICSAAGEPHVKAWLIGQTCGLEYARAEECARHHRRLNALGVLPSRPNERTLVFYLNWSFRSQECELWKSLVLQALTDETSPSKSAIVQTRSARANYEFHELLVKLKLQQAENKNDSDAEPLILETFHRRLVGLGLDDAATQLLTGSSLSVWGPAIASLQRRVYEPVRITPLEKFEHVLMSPQALAILVHRRNEVVAQAFAGPLAMFDGVERGVALDPWRHAAHVLYVLDLTVAPEFRGQLGRLMKELLVALATARGYRAIHGRNRDQYAAAMWAINLSLGAYELQHLVDDYPDHKPYRDCLYYRCPLQWEANAWLPQGFEPMREYLSNHPDKMWLRIAQLVNPARCDGFSAMRIADMMNTRQD